MLTMPRRYKRTRRYKRRSYKKKSGGMTIGDMATAGFNMAKKLVRLINVEKKHYTTNATTVATYAGSIIDLCDPAQGQDQDERIGDSIKPLHLTIRGTVESDDSGGPVQHCRVIIFRYKDENGITININDILDPNLTSTSSVVYCNKNWDKRFHSKILYDKMFTVGYHASGGTTQDGMPPSRYFKFSTKLFGHINWADSATTQEGGGLYMLVVTNGANASNVPVVRWVSRTVYTDN